MAPRLLTMAAGLALCLATPALAQQSTSHLYMFQFKLAPNAAKAYLDNPRDRTGPNRKMAEGFGGKLVGYYVSPPGEYDGFSLLELPDEATARAAALTIWATGNLEKLTLVPLITAEDWKAVMEKAKQNRASYVPPTETK